MAPGVNAADSAPALAPLLRMPIVGACGTVVAVILFEAEEAAEVPIAFVAVTVNVYAVADCNPVTVRGLDAPEAV